MKELNISPENDLKIITDGSVVDPKAVAVLKDAVETILNSSLNSCYSIPFDNLLPRLTCINDLLDQAWQVLGGNPIAASRFKSQLAVFAKDAPKTFSWRRVSTLFNADVQAVLAKRELSPSEGRASDDNPLTPASRILPVIVAAIYSSRSVQELALQLGSIEVGMSGLAELTKLYDLSVLGGDSISMLATISAYNTAVRRVISDSWSDEGGLPTPNNGQFGLPSEWFDGGWTPGSFGGWMGGWRGSPRPVPGELPQTPSSVINNIDECLEEIIPAVHTSGSGIIEFLRGSGDRYEVTGVSPDYACAGAFLTLDGSGFDGTEEVRFTGPAGRTVSAIPESVSSERVTVIVPERALSGSVWPYIPERIRLCAGRSITKAKPGDPGEFLAGRTRIASFDVDGRRSCVAMGSEATINWAVEPSDAEVTIAQRFMGMDTDLFRGVGPAGSVDIDTSVAGFRNFYITARNPHSSCREENVEITLEVAHPAPTLTILGVEVTQGIQRFDLNDLENPNNNSVSLVANMDTVVRVFVKSDRHGYRGDVADITGYLNLNSRMYRPINDSSSRFQSIITAKPSPSRSAINDSLNFLIPAAASRGESETLNIEVWAIDRCPGFVSVAEERNIGWRVREPLPITIRRIADPHTDDVVSEEEALRIVTEAFDRLPSPPTEIRIRPGVFSMGEATAEANYCHGGGFYQLALSMAYEHNGIEGVWPDPHESVWVGIFFQRNCGVGGMMSWPWTSTCITQRMADTAAHEIAHCVGMGHTKTTAGEDCESALQPVACHYLPNGPGDADDGQVLDVIFDIRRNQLRTDGWDLMSYHSGYKFPHPNHWEAIRSRMDDRF